VKRTSIALACALAMSCIPAAAEPGTVKHWAAFPGRDVRAVAFRGYDVGGEPNFVAVQGRDSFVYLRGRLGLYRIFDLSGRNERVADTSECSGWFESQGADFRSGMPVAICARASQIILASAGYHRHVRTPVPTWPGAFRMQGQYRIDERFLTSVIPAANGGYWFAYGYPGGLGRIWPSGRATLHHLAGLGRFRSIAAVGDDVYVMDDECRIAHVRGLRLLTLDAFGTDCGDRRSYWRTNGVAAGADGTVWLFGNGQVERRTLAGRRRRWKLAMTVRALAVARDGTAYAVGADPADRQARALLATIAPGRPPVLRTLPEYGVEAIAIDGRDRIWLSVPQWHAAAVIAAPG
jgi:hypothetical protein